MTLLLYLLAYFPTLTWYLSFTYHTKAILASGCSLHMPYLFPPQGFCIHCLPGLECASPSTSHDSLLFIIQGIHSNVTLTTLAAPTVTFHLITMCTIFIAFR